MTAKGEYEPRDSRDVTLGSRRKEKSWRERQEKSDHRGEYEPHDSRDVTLGEEEDVWHRSEDRSPG